jgi:hypothetical protein
MRFKQAAAIGMLAGCISLPAFAHHSFSMFDDQKLTVLNGTVKEFEWANPHTWIRLVVDDGTGKPLEWSLEMASVSTNAKNGWKSDSVKPGDKISVDIYPLKDGTRGGQVRAVTLTDGHKLGVGGGVYPRGE